MYARSHIITDLCDCHQVTSMPYGNPHCVCVSEEYRLQYRSAQLTFAIPLCVSEEYRLQYRSPPRTFAIPLCVCVSEEYRLQYSSLRLRKKALWKPPSSVSRCHKKSVTFPSKIDAHVSKRHSTRTSYMFMSHHIDGV